MALPRAAPAAGTDSSVLSGATSSAILNRPARASSPTRWSRTDNPVATLTLPSDASATRAPLGVVGMRLSLALDALDPRAERPQALVDAFVPLVDLVGVADRRRSLCAQGCDHHRHPGADVRARHALPVERRRPGDDHTMRVAEDDSCAHRDELVDEEQAALEH